MKKITALLLFILFSNLINAQTVYFSGTISSNTTWAADTVKLTGDVTVALNVTLTIDPGTCIEFQGFYCIHIYGRVLATGNVNDTILFTINDSTGYHDNSTLTGGWHGINFEYGPNTTDTTIFSYCRFMFCKYITINNDQFHGFKLKIQNCLFANNHVAINLREHGNPVIRNNIFKDHVERAIMVEDGCNAIIQNNVFFNNFFGIDAFYTNSEISNNYLSGGWMAINAYHDSSYIANNEIEYFNTAIVMTDTAVVYVYNNIVHDNMRGFQIYHSWPVVIHNTIYNNTGANGGTGIYIGECQPLIAFNRIFSNKATGFGCTLMYGGAGILSIFSTPLIINNLICNNESRDCGSAICLLGNPEGVIVNNTIANNISTQSWGGGIYLMSDTIPNSRFMLANNIFWGNSSSQLNNQLFLASMNDSIFLYNCNIPDTTAACPTFPMIAQGLVFSDPLFVNPTAGTGSSYNGLAADWSLQYGSPCINSGTPDTSGLHLFPTDIAGITRIVDGIIDIGAFEYDKLTGIAAENNSSVDDFFIYPNPSRDFINILLINKNREKLEINIYAADGARLFSKRYSTGASFVNENVDISNYAKGVYLVNISGPDHKKFTRCFIKN